MPQIPEIVVLFVRQFRADADDDGFTDVGTDIRDPHHIGEKIFKVGIEKDITLSAAHAAEMIVLELPDQVRSDLSQRLDVISGIEVALSEGNFCLVQDFFQQRVQDIQL